MHTIVLGIDIARLTFEVALQVDPRRTLKRGFDNSPSGFRQLGRWLNAQGVSAVRAGVESTSVYADALAQWLHDAGHQVHVINPERTAHYSRSQGQRNKTDPADAASIALFVAKHPELPLWQPLPAAHKHLRSLTRVRHQLTHARTQLRQQMATVDAVARPHLEAIEQSLSARLLTVQREIAQHLRDHPCLGEQVRRCQTVPGIGLLTAAIVVAELPPITPQSDPRALCAWTGVTPRRWQSGQSEGPSHLSRKGNAYLRQALYMPALVAKRFNPLLHSFALRLAANGKSSPSILGALSHKLLRILVGLLRSNSDFNPLHSPLHPSI